MGRKQTAVSKAKQLELVNADSTALYVRVSTDKQANEGYSIDAQLGQLRSLCQLHGWNIEHEFIDDGYTGTKVDRPEFTKMIELVKERKITRIVVSKLDRLARNVKDFLQTVDLLQSYGCNLSIVKENFDTSTPQGKFAITMFAAMAELEASMITERVMSGKAQKASTGGYNGSRCPFGYDYDNGFVINASEAQTVKRIFNSVESGMSLRAIVRELEADSIPTKSGGKWHPETLAGILRNKAYAGVTEWAKNAVDSDVYPAIVTSEQFERVQTTLASMKRGNPTFGKE